MNRQHGTPRLNVWFAVAIALVIIGMVAGISMLAPPGTGDSPGTGVEFVEVAEDSGFVYNANDHNQMGNSRAGVYVSDVTNNGYPDLLAIGGDEPVLFLNTGGEFERSDAIPPIDATVNSAVFFDQNGNGWDDLLILPRHDAPIFLANDGGEFEHRDVGLDDIQLRIPVAASVADYNQNGCLDVFVAQNGDWRRHLPMKEQRARDLSRGGDIPSEIAVEEDNGNPNYLFEGDCDAGTFTDVTTDVGIDGERWSMATSFTDFTGNGYPDIHEANDFNYDILWVNQAGEGFLREQILRTNRHAMSSEVADFSGNGQMDIFVTNIHFKQQVGAKQILDSIDNSGNNLLINRNGTFSTEEHDYNVRDGGWGWAAVTTDFDNTGELDLIHTTHHELNMTDPEKSVLTHPRVWIRDGDRFARAEPSEGGFIPQNGRGLATLDYNRNGKEDLVTTNLDGAYKLYENRGGSGQWLQIAVKDDQDATVHGAQVTVRYRTSGTDGHEHHLVTKARTDLLSQSTRVHHIGLGDATQATVEVTWPDGEVRTFDGVDANQRIAVYPNGTLKTQSAHGNGLSD